MDGQMQIDGGHSALMRLRTATDVEADPEARERLGCAVLVSRRSHRPLRALALQSSL
jgi:hypothetical protein